MVQYAQKTKKELDAEKAAMLKEEQEQAEKMAAMTPEERMAEKLRLQKIVEEVRCYYTRTYASHMHIYLFHQQELISFSVYILADFFEFTLFYVFTK